MEKIPCNRRSFAKRVGAAAIGSSVLGSTNSGASNGSGSGSVSPDDTIEERIRKSDPQELLRFFSEQYGSNVAKKVVQLWKRYTDAILKGRLNRDEALTQLFDEVKQLSPQLRHDINRAQTLQSSEDVGFTSQYQAKVESGELEPDDPSVTNISTQDTQELLLIDGQVGGSGVGFRDSHYYVNINTLTSIVEIVAIGSITQWAWLEGNFYVENGGTHEIVADYWHNGFLGGGGASYDIWLQEGDSFKTWLDLRDVSASVFGNESRAVQATLSSDSVYNFGIRLKTSINGLTEAVVDYQTVNADGSTRQLEINNMHIEPV